MFTGIVTDMGTVRSIDQRGDTLLAIDCNYEPADVTIGASISCQGVCLTVIEVGPGEDGAPCSFAAEASAETLACTNLGNWAVGTRINLERALKVGDELGGHIVSGHVDGVGKVASIAAEGDSTRLGFTAPRELLGLIATKGSIAVDGVSLTVNDVSSEGFGINVIPHTQKVTTLGSLKVGDQVNLEVDVLARYVARLSEVGQAS